MFIQLGQKHASKGEMELAVFEVFGECRLGVRDLGLLLAVVSFELRRGVPSFVYTVGYSAHTDKQSFISTHITGRARGRRSKGRGEYISPRERVGSAGVLLGRVW
jgi:hypothetical protein